MLVKIIVIAVLAVAVGVVTYQLNKKNLAIGFIGSLVMVAICLLMLAPAGFSEEHTGSQDVFKHKLTAMLPCEHKESVNDYAKGTYVHATVYTNNFEFFILGDNSTTYIEYCPKCYTLDSARKYYKDNKNSDGAFLNSVD